MPTASPQPSGADLPIGIIIAPDASMLVEARPPASLPDVFDHAGWTDLAAGLDRFDPGRLIERLDEFSASGATARMTFADGGDWRAPIVAMLRDHVKDTIDLLLARTDEDEAATARKIASEAITHPDSPYHDRIRSAFHDGVSEIAEEARRLTRAYGHLRTDARVVPLATVPEPHVASHAERVERHLDITSAIETEKHPGRKVTLRMAYEGYTKKEIAERLSVTEECIRLYLRDCRSSPFLAAYAEDFVDRRRL